MRVLLLVLFTCALGTITPLAGQTTSSARQYINDLKEGTLVVCLQLNQKKTAYLTDLADGSGSKLARKAQKMLDKHQADRLKYAHNVMDEIELNYDFSKVVYLPSHKMSEFSKGVRSGIFVGRDLNVDPSIELLSDKGLMAVRGSRDDVIYLKTWEGAELPKSFPAKPKPGFLKLLVRFVRNHLRDNVISLNKNLHEFYKKGS